MRFSGTAIRFLAMGTALSALSACVTDTSAIDWDLRQNGASTAEAARAATAPRPAPDARGVISYPGYQVAVARTGDTVASVAQRIGMPVAELASYNALPAEAPLNQGEVLALPRRVSEPAGGTATAGAMVPSGGNAGGSIEVTTLAGAAIDRASGSTAPATTAPVVAPGGVEPIRHKVVRGETAYTIARAYNVSAKSLAEWNGLGPDLAVREGQYLLIPVAMGEAPPSATAVVTPPGSGSPTPEPPSAAKPLPKEKTTPAAKPAEGTPDSPDLSKQRTAASASKFAMPAEGSIIRGYVPKKNDGIDIGAAAGSPVKAAGDGSVVAITRDTNQVQIIIIRHADNLLTVYANVDGIKVAKGDTVKRGQTIAAVRPGSPAFLHFEVRKGSEAVDPMPYLQ